LSSKIAPGSNIFVYLNLKQLYRQEVLEQRSGIEEVVERCFGAFRLNLITGCCYFIMHSHELNIIDQSSEKQNS